MEENQGPNSSPEENPSLPPQNKDASVETKLVQETPSLLAQKIEAIKEEVAKKLVGQEDLVEMILVALFCDGHVLIEGVPGVAKTFTARLITKVLDAGFTRIQFTPDLMPSDIIGTTIFNSQTNAFEFKKGPIFNNLILIDEVNRAPAKTQSALFEAMEERQVSVDGTSYPMDFPFIVLATQNPVEHEGTYKLPEAQLDRFLFKLNVNYPTIEEEVKILEAAMSPSTFNELSDVKTILTKAELQDFRKQINAIKVDPKLIKYIAQIADVTRGNSQLFLGASPRASIGVLNASKTIAAFRGRDFVTPEDVRETITAVLKHRLILTPEKEIEGITVEQIITEIIEQVEVPR